VRHEEDTEHNRHLLGVAIVMKKEEKEPEPERRSKNAGDVLTMCRD